MDFGDGRPDGPATVAFDTVAMIDAHGAEISGVVHTDLALARRV